MIFCNSCGQQNEDSSKFCKKCGEPVVATTGRLRTGILLDKRYKIKRMIKSGGMGAVYEALDQRFSNNPCAVKEMLSQSSSPDEQAYMINRFKEEAELLHVMRHQNLPVVKDYFVDQGRYYLVMDYIEGKDLEAVMASYGKGGVPEKQVIDWTKQILSALDYLHSQSPPIVYRDLKPGNIMLRTSDERIMLVDFGIARSVAPGSQTSKTIVGTPAFAPEEIFQGNPEPRTDIYSLGGTMHCLLTGIIPATPFSFVPVRQLNPNVSEELEAIILKALARNINERYRNAREMNNSIELLSIDILSPQAFSSQATILPPKLQAKPTRAVPVKEEKAESLQPAPLVARPPSLPTPSQDIVYPKVSGEKKGGGKRNLVIIGVLLLLLLLGGGCIILPYILYFLGK